MFQHGDLLGYFQFLKDQRFGFVLYVFQFLQCFDAMLEIEVFHHLFPAAVEVIDDHTCQ